MTEEAKKKEDLPEPEAEREKSKSDWSFAVSELDIKAASSLLKKKKESSQKKKKKKFDGTLILDRTTLINHKISRRQLARENNGNDDEIRDSFVDKMFPLNPFLRLFALLIDLFSGIIIFYALSTFKDQIEEMANSFSFFSFLNKSFKFDLTFIYNIISSFNPELKIELDTSYGHVLSFNNLVLPFLFFILLMILYIFPLSARGKSIGLHVVNAKLVDEDGHYLSVAKILIRQFILTPLSLISIIGPFTMFLNKKKQTLQDRLIRSVVRQV